MPDNRAVPYVHAAELKKLRQFFKTVARLTVNHDCVTVVKRNGQQDDLASVSPKKLGDALSKVNPDWYKQL